MFVTERRTSLLTAGVHENTSGQDEPRGKTFKDYFDANKILEIRNKNFVSLRFPN